MFTSIITCFVIFSLVDIVLIVATKKRKRSGCCDYIGKECFTEHCPINRGDIVNCRDCYLPKRCSNCVFPCNKEF